MTRCVQTSALNVRNFAFTASYVAKEANLTKTVYTNVMTERNSSPPEKKLCYHKFNQVCWVYLTELVKKKKINGTWRRNVYALSINIHFLSPHITNNDNSALRQLWSDTAINCALWGGEPFKSKCYDSQGLVWLSAISPTLVHTYSLSIVIDR